MVVIRENSEGLYSGVGGFHRKGTRHEVAVQSSVNTRHGVERIVRYAFDHAMRPERRRQVTLVHKTNVLTFAGDLYQRVVHEVAAEYPDVATDYVHVDAACIYFLDQPVALRRDRHGQHVRRHHHGPRRDDPGRDGDRRGRQHQPGRRVDVRADRRHRAVGDRQGHDQPARRDRRHRDAARRSSARSGRRRASTPGSGSPARSSRRCAPARWATPPRRSATSSSRRPRYERRCDRRPRPPRRALRHDAARRRPGAGSVLLRRGPDADPPQARPARPAVHRGRLAGREPARHGVLPPRREGDARSTRSSSRSG